MLQLIEFSISYNKIKIFTNFIAIIATMFIYLHYKVWEIDVNNDNGINPIYLIKHNSNYERIYCKDKDVRGEV